MSDEFEEFRAATVLRQFDHLKEEYEKARRCQIFFDYLADNAPGILRMMNLENHKFFHAMRHSYPVDPCWSAKIKLDTYVDAVEFFEEMNAETPMSILPMVRCHDGQYQRLVPLHVAQGFTTREKQPLREVPFMPDKASPGYIELELPWSYHCQGLLQYPTSGKVEAFFTGPDSEIFDGKTPIVEVIIDLKYPGTNCSARRTGTAASGLRYEDRTLHFTDERLKADMSYGWRMWSSEDSRGEYRRHSTGKA